MKKLFYLLLISSSVFSQVKSPADITYQVVNKESQIVWKSPTMVGSGHDGTIQLTSGTLVTAANGKVKGGNFVMNMKSISSLDPKSGKRNKGLEEHLNDDDFFSTMRFPIATFIITKIAPGAKPNEYTITGNMTIKGISNVVTFSTVINTDKDTAKAQATFTINRTLWGITCKSYSFLAQMKDDLISNDIILSLNLVFKRSN